jgi:hypothetical protein
MHEFVDIPILRIAALLINHSFLQYLYTVGEVDLKKKFFSQISYIVQ